MGDKEHIDAERHADGNRIRYQYVSPTVRDEHGGWEFETMTTVWVPDGTTFEDARARSMAFTIDERERFHHTARLLDWAEWGWIMYEYPDGSSGIGASGGHKGRGDPRFAVPAAPVASEVTSVTSADLCRALAHAARRPG